MVCNLLQFTHHFSKNLTEFLCKRIFCRRCLRNFIAGDARGSLLSAFFHPPMAPRLLRLEYWGLVLIPADRESKTSP
jgi:hypothetical protein